MMHQHQVKSSNTRKPNDTGREVTRTHNRKISGKVHFGVQATQHQHQNANLPKLLEDKSNHFSGHLTPSKMGKSNLDIDHDVSLFGASRAGLRDIPSLKVENGSGNGDHFLELMSISTLGDEKSFKQDAEVSSGPAKKLSAKHSESPLKDLPWVIKQSPNEPHPVLDVPPLYFLIKNYPGALDTIKSLYQLRWRMSYPLQRRVFLSQQLRKVGIFFTWGELLLLFPFLAMILGGIVFTFAYPSIFWSGHIARLALILAIATAVRNSLITMLIGLPFERALWYHKLSGRIALFNGILHTVVAHRDAIEKAFFNFLFADQMNASGTGLAMLCGGVVLTSFPQIRKKAFEFFYYAHIIFVSLMTVCAFYHSGVLIPILATLLWGGDLFCRKIVMACCLYPHKARIRAISESVVEICFPKTKGFNYNAGQHLSLAVPEISIFEWHPFSIASCPRQKNVTVLIRVAGDWTSALHKIAKTKKEISILVEGPNGNPNVDLFNKDRYKHFLLFSGGIGITPIQSVCHQLVYEQSKGQRDLERIRVVWTERDPVLMDDIDVVNNGASCHFSAPFDVEDLDLRSLASHGVFNEDEDSQCNSMASALLALVPPSKRTDAELEQDYPFEASGNAGFSLRRKRTCDRTITKQRLKQGSRRAVADGGSTFHEAFQNPSLQDILDMQIYLTSKDANRTLSNLPFVHSGRPDVDQIFEDARKEGLIAQATRAAVIVCAPPRLAQELQNACVKYSDDEFQFDIHIEYQD